MNSAKRYPGNIASTNQTTPRRVILRKRSRGEQHYKLSCRRSPAAAMCSCLGSVLAQNQSGERKAASYARERVMVSCKGAPNPSNLFELFKLQKLLAWALAIVN